MFFNSRIVADESVKFAFKLDGGTGGVANTASHLRISNAGGHNNHHKNSRVDRNTTKSTVNVEKHHHQQQHISSNQ